MRYKDTKKLLSLQNAGTEAVYFCGATLLDAFASSQFVRKYKGFVNADLCVLPTQGAFPPLRLALGSPFTPVSHTCSHPPQAL